MAKFIGRREEINLLLDSFRRHKGVINVVRGRRRVGKTRMIRQLDEIDKTIDFHYLTSSPPNIEISDKQERELYAGQVKAVFELSFEPPASSWRELFSFIAEQVKRNEGRKKIVLAIDEVNWLATKSKTFLSEFHTLWETQFSHIDRFMLIVSGSLSSWLEEHFIMHQGYVGRISKDIILKEMPLADIAQFFAARRSRLSDYEIIKHLCTIGGVPRYMEEIDVRKDAQANIKALFFNPAGMLYREFNQMFNDLYSEQNKFYQTILRTIAITPKRLTPGELAKKMNMGYSGRFSTAIKILHDTGFVAMHKIWNTSSKILSSKYVLSIGDCYTAFYFRAVDRYKQSIQLEAKLPAHLPSIIGLQFENLVYANANRVIEALGIRLEDVIFQGSHYQSQTNKTLGCQIDYLIHTRQNTVYVCELKFYAGQIDVEIIDDMEQKLARLVQSKGVSFRPVLIHANKVSEQVILSDYFDSILDLGSLLG